ncbi:MAG: PAS domain-containing sensor histidine kinase [Gemmatimonadetes bacterium]|nr:PAS domain-containing sensor histidine kinase [Gemmatimonadota bacterium]
MFLLTDDELRAVYDASPDGCLVVGSDGTIRGANRRIGDLFGWPPAELVGQPIEVLVPEALRGAHEGHRSTFTDDPHTRPMGVGLDLRARRKDGSTFPAEISLSPWRAGESPLRIVCTVRDVTEQRRLRTFSVGALRATEEERQRISRELHDDIAQRLATLVLKVRRLADEADSMARKALGETVRRDVIDTSDAVRLMARALRPPELEEVGLALAIQAHARRVREATGFDVVTELEAVGEALDETGMLAVYRIVQEALSNAKRHSGTDRAVVRLASVGGRVVAEVEDSGEGFIVPEVGGADGLGIIGMQERAEMIGGSLELDSAPGRGTRVRIVVPS